MEDGNVEKACGDSLGSAVEGMIRGTVGESGRKDEIL